MEGLQQHPNVAAFLGVVYDSGMVSTVSDYCRWVRRDTTRYDTTLTRAVNQSLDWLV
jgi:hypothetical protein